jgi:type I restriction enzyme, S subunit
MSGVNQHKPGYKHTPLGWIPEEWKVERIEDVATLNPARKYMLDDEQVSFLGMADVSEEGKVLNGYIRQYGDVKNGFTYFENNDILVAKITPCFENYKGALVNNLKNGVGFGSTEFHVIRAGERVLPNYIFHHTRFGVFRSRGEQNMTGTAGQKRIPADFIATYKIPVPEIKEQRKIVTILSTWDEAITNPATHYSTTATQQRFDAAVACCKRQLERISHWRFVKGSQTTSGVE